MYIKAYDYWLASVGLSNKKKHDLNEYFEGSKNVYEAKPKELIGCPGIDLSDMKKIDDAKRAVPLEEYEKLKEKEIGFISVNDNYFPEMLLNIHDCPFGLFYKGEFPDDFTRAIAMVGARKPSAYGRSAAQDLAKALAQNGATIISGMAMGIDCASHSGALLAGGQTIAILGCGVDICYPNVAKNIYKSILEKGCIISEFPPGATPRPAYFPLRNRIISGLSRVTIVIEAKIRSGSLITADCALEQGRDVFALPGRITDDLSGGTNRLIEQGAGIIRSIPSVIETFLNMGYLGALDCKNEVIKNADEFFVLEKEEEVVYSCLDFSPVGINEIMLRTNLPAYSIADALISLLSRGIIRREGMNTYTKSTTWKVSNE